MQQLLRNAVDLSMIASGQVSLPILSDIVRSAATSADEVNSEEWREKAYAGNFF